MHKLLERQLRKHFASLDAVPADLGPLLERIDRAYAEAEEDRRLLERSMELTSEELLARNDDLRHRIEEKDRIEKALRESEADYRRIVETASEGIWTSRVDGKTLFVNAAMASMLGHPRQVLERKTPLDFVDPTADSDAARLSALPSGPEGDRFEVRFRRSDGGVLWAMVAATAVMDGDRPVGVLRMFADITARKRAEEGLQTAYQRLKEEDELRGRFLNTAAHELATPLTPLKLQVQIVRRRLAHLLDDKGQRSLDILERNVERLGLLVGDLLDSARLQSGTLRLDEREADLAQVVHAAVATFRPVAEERGLHVDAEADGELPVRCDPGRIGQVMDNLLTNAMKFTPSGGTVAVRVAKRGRMALVTVSDTGIGIAPTETRRLFQPFSQLRHPDTPVQHGTGLGLYISKGLVERSGGRVWVDSEGEGKGASFSFCLPIADPAGPGPGTAGGRGAAKPPPPGLSKRKGQVD